jgi:transitional endoplasmic reticulum ATPase
LLSPFVGGTEKQIAGVFEKALEDDAILMIDEVDSFLQDRAKAVRSWEVTQVNELLTRMETFQRGVHCHHQPTGTPGCRQPAPFRPETPLWLSHCQIHELLRAWCRSLGIASPGDEHRDMIETMECVTPGDFAAVARRHRFQPFAMPTVVFRRWPRCDHQNRNRCRRIGFQ